MSVRDLFAAARVALVVVVPLTTLDAQKKGVHSAGHLCGVVDHLQLTPVPGRLESYKDERTPLPSLSLIFYQQQLGQSCCDGLKQIATASTDKKGRFELPEVGLGRYWLSTEWNHKSYKYAFEYPFSSDPDATCARQGIDLKDDGSAAWWKTITLY